MINLTQGIAPVESVPAPAAEGVEAFQVAVDVERFGDALEETAELNEVWCIEKAHIPVLVTKEIVRSFVCLLNDLLWIVWVSGIESAGDVRLLKDVLEGAIQLPLLQYQILHIPHFDLNSQCRIPSLDILVIRLIVFILWLILHWSEFKETGLNYTVVVY